VFLRVSEGPHSDGSKNQRSLEEVVKTRRRNNRIKKGQLYGGKKCRKNIRTNTQTRRSTTKTIKGIGGTKFSQEKIDATRRSGDEPGQLEGRKVV